MYYPTTREPGAESEVNLRVRLPNFWPFAFRTYSRAVLRELSHPMGGAAHLECGHVRIPSGVEKLPMRRPFAPSIGDSLPALT
jgi:hypothetical protein